MSARTLLLSWMIVVMLSAVFPGLASRERCRHSMGRIFLYSAASISVSCRASSRGSMSSNLSFLLVFGMIGAGGARGTVFVVLIGASPPRCYRGDMRTKERCVVEVCELTARSMRMSNCLAAAKLMTTSSDANSFIRERMYISSFSRTSSSVTMDLKVLITLGIYMSLS